MAEDFGEKTEAPTPRRRLEAHEQGNIPKSQDLNAAVLVLGLIVLLAWFGPGVVAALRTLLEEMLGPAAFGQLSADGAAVNLLRAVVVIAGAMAPIFAGVMLIAILINVAQVGLSAHPKRLQPKLSALNPIKGIGRIFKGGKGFVQFGMNVMKLVLVAALAWWAIHGRLDQIVGIAQLSYIQVFGLGAELVWAIGIRLGLLLFVLALLDYAYQRWRVEKDLKMSKREVKEEMRRMEGDPLIRQRRRQIAQQMSLQRLKSSVPQADVIVTNPTEFAVALKYDSATMHAPKVVAKGQDLLARRIREIAIAEGIPILERKPLARALYQLCEVGQEIPEQFYAAVAEILAYVYELSGKMRVASSQQTVVGRQ